MEQIFSQLFYEVEKHRDTVLVTLIADRGSAPRKAGAQMLVGAEGRLVGTIGGGAVEGRSIQLCRELLAQHISTCVADDLRAGSEEKLDELIKLLPKLMK